MASAEGAPTAAAVLVHAAVPHALRGERGAHEQAGHGQEQDAGDAHGGGGWVCVFGLAVGRISNRCERAFVLDFTLSRGFQGAPCFQLTMLYIFDVVISPHPGTKVRPSTNKFPGYVGEDKVLGPVPAERDDSAWHAIPRPDPGPFVGRTCCQHTSPDTRAPASVNTSLTGSRLELKPCSWHAAALEDPPDCDP